MCCHDTGATEPPFSGVFVEREVLYDTRGLTKVTSISITRRRICMWTKPDYEIRVISSEDFWWRQVGTCVTKFWCVCEQYAGRVCLCHRSPNNLTSKYEYRTVAASWWQQRCDTIHALAALLNHTWYSVLSACLVLYSSIVWSYLV